MKRVWQVSALALVVILLLCSSAMAAPLSSDASAVITKGHVYKVRPGSAEWKTYSDLDQKIAACSVERDELAKMPTPALVETVLTYPLLGNVFAFDSIEEGIESVASYFPGMDELFSRGDGLEVLRRYRDDAVADCKAADDRANRLARYKADALVQYLETPLVDGGRAAALGGVALSSYSGYVYTPRGSRVPVTWDRAWSSGEEQAQYDRIYEDLMTYPSTQLLRWPSPKYNCHSYAWYSQSSSNIAWMMWPFSYMSDGSYVRCSARVGAKLYFAGSSHSGIVTQVPSSGPVRVTSKWSAGPLYSHDVFDCPYAAGGYVSYYKRP
jgi:hypothetical protein